MIYANKDGKMVEMTDDEYRLGICQDHCQHGGIITMDTMEEVEALLDGGGGRGEIEAEEVLTARHRLSYGDMRAIIRYLKNTLAE